MYKISHQYAISNSRHQDWGKFQDRRYSRYDTLWNKRFPVRKLLLNYFSEQRNPVNEQSKYPLKMKTIIWDRALAICNVLLITLRIIKGTKIWQNIDIYRKFIRKFGTGPDGILKSFSIIQQYPLHFIWISNI